MSPGSLAAPSSLLAAASTAHLVIALLLWHAYRRRGVAELSRAFSFAFVPVPWFFTTPRDLAVGLAANVAWAAAVALLLPAGAPALHQGDASPSPPVPRPRGDGLVPVSVLATTDETDEIRTFRLERPHGFDFVAGQFLTVAVTIEGRKLTRCYSITSAPEAAGYLEISVKRQGLVSGALHAAIRPGSVLRVRRPAGRFRYPEEDGHLVLVAGGVGITPLMSMLRHAVARDPNRRVTLLLSVRAEKDVPYRRELETFGRDPRVQILVALSRGNGAPGFLSGRFDEARIRAAVPEGREALYYICGPNAMIESVRSLLADRLGVPQSRIRFEAFGAASKAVPVSEETIRVARQRRRTERRPARKRERFSLSLVRSGHTVEISGCETLLEAVEAARVSIPNSCRAGVCGTCRTRLIDGDVVCQGDALEPGDREKGYVLPCVAFAQGNCAIEA